MATAQFTRKSTSLEESTNRFVAGRSTKGFAPQFSPLYFHRLSVLKAGLEERVRAVWGNDVPICPRVPDVQEQECVLIGTLFKDMKLRGSPLDKFLGKDAAVLPADGCMVHEEDTVIVEDSFGRMQLGGPLIQQKKDYLVSGIVCALKGKEVSAKFVVDDICLPGVPPQSTVSTPDPSPSAKHIMLVSGLHLGIEGHDSLAMQMCIDFAAGYLGMEEDQETAASISRVIIAGNSLVEVKHDPEDRSKKERQQDTLLTQPLKELDMWLTELCASVDVHLMPGDTDPASLMLPQQPLHRCLFPSSTTYSSFHRETNPFQCTVDGLSILGTSGQTVSDLKRFSNSEDGTLVSYLESTLRWRNMAPTAPDSLVCYPFQNDDPFLLSECPHVYFVGNMERFESRLFTAAEGQKVRVVCVPSFQRTGEVVLLDVTSPTLECSTMRFACGVAPEAGDGDAMQEQ